MKPLLPVVVLLLGAALAGCSEEPEPIVAAPTESASAPATPQASPETSEPVERESAEEFIRRYQHVVVSMQRTGDTEDYRALTTDCPSCRPLEELVAGIYSDGRSIQIDDTTVVRFQSVGRSGRVRIVEFVLISPPARVVSGNGETIETYSGGRERYQVNLVPSGSSWNVLRVSEVVA
ncbi:MAG: hypothetical protein CMH83_18520 [Nocardioides sp.]|nr:hypothetical protein [Nocardioides sp.]